MKRVRAQRDQAVLLLGDVLKLIDGGVLVRDISRDHECGWAMKQLRLVQILGSAAKLVAALNPPPSDGEAV